MNSTCRHAPTLEILTRTLTAVGRLGTQLAQILRSGDHRRIVAVSINPKGYTDWRQFFADYSSLSLCKKYPYLSLPGVNPKVSAEEKFLASEDQCRKVNFMFTHPSGMSHETRSILNLARRHVRRVLGRFCLDDILPYLSHGPGSTYGTRKACGHPWYKFGDLKPTVTGDCLALHRAHLEYNVLWKRIHSENSIDPKVVGGSKVTTVPKDARCDRLIAIEPLLNMFYQKGVGGLMRSRLARSGCDLNDQTVNQELAHSGSLTGRLATIDLSSASDSIARCLVEYLLPPDWLLIMNVTRSHFTEFRGEKIFLQKFSSMGNGFTFELESLIFLALGRAVSQFYGKESVVSVYGDDIIVSSDMAPLLIRLLAECGFTTNREKTFLDGPFRESCGKHYFLGHDVTPLYVKDDIQDDMRYLWYLNSIRRLAFRFLGMSYGCDATFLPVYVYVYRKLDCRYQKLSIPDGFGDGGVVRDWDEVSPKPRSASSWVEGYVVRHATRVYIGFDPFGFSQLLVSLFRLGVNPPSGKPWHYSDCRDSIPDIVPRQRYRIPIVKSVVTRWRCLGPWVSLL